MLQHDQPGDFVVGTGETHTVEDFLREAFSYAGLDHRDHVEIDAKYFRPTEVDILKADASRVKNELGWTPRVSFGELVRIMVDADLKAEGVKAPGEGKKILLNKGFTWMGRP